MHDFVDDNATDAGDVVDVPSESGTAAAASTAFGSAAAFLARGCSVQGSSSFFPHGYTVLSHRASFI